MTSALNRSGSANAYDSGLRNITSRQTALSNLQEQLTSGKRVVRASDDPTSAAVAERALNRLSRITADQRALEAQRSSIAQGESTLGDINDALQSFRELVVSAGNGTHTAVDRQTIATQLSGLRDQVFAMANRQDTNGQPLFGALGSQSTPFTGPAALPTDYTFQGLPGQPPSTSVSIPFALDGNSAFMLQPARDGVFNTTVGNNSTTLKTDAVVVTNSALVTGSSYTISNISTVSGTAPGTSRATYLVTETPTVSSAAALGQVFGPDYSPASKTIPITVPGLSFNLIGAPTNTDSVTLTPSPSIFSVMDSAIRDIGSAANNNAASQAVSQAIGNIDIGMAHVSSVRGQAGELLNRTDRITNDQGNRIIQLESSRSKAEDIDMVKAISQFNNQQTGYQAALQTYAQIKKLSLFDFIR